MSKSASSTPFPTVPGCIVGCDGSDHAGQSRERAMCQAYSHFGYDGTTVAGETTGVYAVRYASMREGADASVVITHDDHEGSHLIEVNPQQARALAVKLIAGAELAEYSAAADVAAMSSWPAA